MEDANQKLVQLSPMRNIVEITSLKRLMETTARGTRSMSNVCKFRIKKIPAEFTWIKIIAIQ